MARLGLGFHLQCPLSETVKESIANTLASLRSRITGAESKEYFSAEDDRAWLCRIVLKPQPIVLLLRLQNRTTGCIIKLGPNTSTRLHQHVVKSRLFLKSAYCQRLYFLISFLSRLPPSKVNFNRHIPAAKSEIFMLQDVQSICRTSRSIASKSDKDCSPAPYSPDAICKMPVAGFGNTRTAKASCPMETVDSYFE
jgi:hypothetical protein